MDGERNDINWPAPLVRILFAVRVNDIDHVLDLVAIDDITFADVTLSAGAPFTMWIRTGLERHPLDEVLGRWADAGEVLELRWEPPEFDGRGWLLLESLDTMIALKAIDLIS
jgi:hypothetical protein